MRKVIAPDDLSFVSALPKRKTRHPPLKKSGAMTNAERLRCHRRKVAREKKLANPKLKAKQARRAERERALAGRILALPGKRYGVIYGDPEWRDEVWGRETGLDRAPDNHYATSPDEIIKSRPVETIAAKDCVLFLWSTVQHLAVAIEVMQKWGFEYKSRVMWVKPSISLGRWIRSRHEVLLIGTRGKIPCPALGTQWESYIDSPRGAHSERPDVFAAMVEKLYPTVPKIELNARRVGPGWTVWGLEAHQKPT